MTLNMKIFVGIDCDENQLVIAFVSSQGMRKSLSTTGSPLPQSINMFGERVVGMLGGLRGDENLRMKNFCGIGIGIPAAYLKFRADIESQIKERLKLPVFIEDRDLLIKTGESWLIDVKDLIDRNIDQHTVDLRGPYGAAKMVVDYEKSLGC